MATRAEPVVLGAGRPTTDLPRLLGDFHRALEPEDEIHLVLAPTPDRGWSAERATDLLAGSGFKVDHRVVLDEHRLEIRATRLRSLADTVGPEMHLLVVGLNPSPASADAGIGYAGPGNRFWPAATEAGLVSVDRDPHHALTFHGLGMTDLVRRTSVRADEVHSTEYRAGAARVERLVAWLQPRAVCFVGLGGWRTVVNHQAVAGTQLQNFGGRPVYVMPNTSGLNTHCRLADLVAHFRAANALAAQSSAGT